MKRLALALAALAVVAIALLAWTPAALVLPQTLPASLVLQDVRGTLWRGQAAQLVWQGEPLGTLAWESDPRSLVRGDLAIRLQLSGPMQATANLHPGIARSRLEDVRLALPAQWLDGVLATPTLHPRGRIELQLARMVFEGGQWQAGTGQARWRAAALTGATAAPLGELRADFAGTAPGHIEGRLHDDGGPLALSGHFALAPAGYRVVAELAARDPALAPTLAWLGQPTETGRQLELQGRLTVRMPALATF